jgi:hypothetical protein
MVTIHAAMRCAGMHPIVTTALMRAAQYAWGALATRPVSSASACACASSYLPWRHRLLTTQWSKVLIQARAPVMLSEVRSEWLPCHSPASYTCCIPPLGCAFGPVWTCMHCSAPFAEAFLGAHDGGRVSLRHCPSAATNQSLLAHDLSCVHMRLDSSSTQCKVRAAGSTAAQLETTLFLYAVYVSVGPVRQSQPQLAAIVARCACSSTLNCVLRRHSLKDTRAQPAEAAATSLPSAFYQNRGTVLRSWLDPTCHESDHHWHGLSILCTALCSCFLS